RCACGRPARGRSSATDPTGGNDAAYRSCRRTHFSREAGRGPPQEPGGRAGRTTGTGRGSGARMAWLAPSGAVGWRGNRHRPDRAGSRPHSECEAAAMRVEFQADRTAYRRHRRGMLLFILAAALLMPSVPLVLSGPAAVLVREAVRPYTGAAYLAGLLAVLTTYFYGAWQALSYRCPRCGRHLPRVVPRDESHTNIHYHCAGCRVIWDLGWGRGESA